MGMQGKFGFFDTLVNFVSRIGVSGDKAVGNTYAAPSYNKTEIDAAYRSSWLARKVIDIPPLDMTREWRNWQASEKQIEDMEQWEKDFGIVTKTRRALTWGRLYGGGALILGVDQGNANTPLDIEKVTQGSLKFVHALHRFELIAQDVIRDPMDPLFGQPKMYQVNSAQQGSVEIHPSRVIRFLGNEYPDEAMSGADQGWSDPYWMTLRDIVTQNDALSAVISSLVQEAKVDVITVPNLMEMVGTDVAEERLLKRFTLAMTMKSLNNTTLLDGGPDGKSGEQWTRKEMNFGGLDGIMKLFLAVAAGAADIPATRLLGKAPDGMNATGDSDTRNYYDMLSSRQELELWPSLIPLDKIMQLHLFGKIDDNIYFESAPLWQMTPAENADIASKKAATSKVYADMNVMPDLAFAKIVQNQLIEDATFPGIEAALKEFGDEPEAAPIPLMLAGPGQTALPAHLPPKQLPAPVRTTDFQDAMRRLDPTNTGVIRKSWKMGITKLFRTAETRIKSLIKGSEGVGLDQQHYRDLLENVMGGQEWFGKYVVRAYRRGLDDATQRLGSNMKFPFVESDVSTMRDVASRVQFDLSVIADELSKQIADAVKASVTVPEALSRASERISAIGIARAQTVAAVHTIGTHARASLNYYKRSGIKYVGADIEAVPHRHRMGDAEELLQFATAGDNLVCPECEDMEGQIFTIEEAEGVIPVHPNCRCAWIPIREPSGRFNKRLGVEDASSRSLYVHRPVINTGDIVKWAKEQGFQSIVPGDDMHVTICYSRTPFDWMKTQSDAPGEDDKGRITVRPGGIRIVERLGPQAVVLLFNSSVLSARHEQLRVAGAATDFDEYQPHVTLTYNTGSLFNLSAIVPYKGEIILGPEVFEEINDFDPSTVQEEMLQ